MDMLIVISLILLNGLFAMSEVALLTARRSRLQSLSQGGRQTGRSGDPVERRSHALSYQPFRSALPPSGC